MTDAAGDEDSVAALSQLLAEHGVPAHEGGGQEEPQGRLPSAVPSLGTDAEEPFLELASGVRSPFLRKEVDRARLIGKPAGARGWEPAPCGRPLPLLSLPPGPGAHTARVTEGKGADCKESGQGGREQPGEQW